MVVNITVFGPFYVPYQFVEVVLLALVLRRQLVRAGRDAAYVGLVEAVAQGSVPPLGHEGSDAGLVSLVIAGLDGAQVQVGIEQVVKAAALVDLVCGQLPLLR